MKNSDLKTNGQSKGHGVGEAGWLLLFLKLPTALSILLGAHKIVCFMDLLDSTSSAQKAQEVFLILL